MYLGEGKHSQPELYALEDRDSVEFDNFSGFEKYIKKFKDNLKNYLTKIELEQFLELLFPMSFLK